MVKVAPTLPAIRSRYWLEPEGRSVKTLGRISQYVTSAAFTLAFATFPTVVRAQSAIEHHVWQDQRSFAPYSHTAESITGTISLSGNPKFAGARSTMLLTFESRSEVQLTSVGAFWRKWDIASDAKVTAEVFQFENDPGTLKQGNTLCGDQPARFIAFFEFSDMLGNLTLGVDVFSSREAPKDIDSKGLCGTFSYAID